MEDAAAGNPPPASFPPTVKTVGLTPAPASGAGDHDVFTPFTPQGLSVVDDDRLDEKEMEEVAWVERVSAEVSIPVVPAGARTSASGPGEEQTLESVHSDLPVFADEQSRAVNEEIKRLEKALEASDAQLKEQKDRLRILEEHLANVQQEVQHTNLLVDAKRKERDTEEHFRQLSMREQGRVKEEMRRGKTKLEDLQDQMNVVQNAIFCANEGMDQFKLQMNWNQEELEQWALAAKQKEEDNLVLQKYAKGDDLKIKELTLALEKLTQAMVDRKAEVDMEVTNSQAKQMELDRIADDFKALHVERQALVRQWQEAIEAMRKRDADINDLGMKYSEARQRRAEQLELLSENQERLKLQEEDNAEVDMRTKAVERGLQKKRLELMDSHERLSQFKDELEVMKSELGSNAGILNRRRAENTVLGEQLEEKRKVLESERKKFQGVKRKLEVEETSTKSAEVTVKEAEADLTSKEYDYRQLLGHVEQLKAQQFRLTQDLAKLRQDEADLIAEIYGARSTAKNLQAKIHQLDQQSTRQQELLYNAEFQIQQMERKVARGLGERSDEEKKVLTDQIAKLEAQADEIREKKKMLVLQSRKLSFDLKAALRKKESFEKQAIELEQRILELELENGTSEQKVKHTCKDKEELMVQSDLLKLDMKRLRDCLNAKKDELFSLENRKQQLVLSMEERKQEIAVHRDTQRAQLRMAEDEKRRVVVELNERAHQVERLKSKFEVLEKGSVVRMDDDDGDVDAGHGMQSQAYFMIKAAQKREELQREGDNLDQEIQKCEREIRAMQNTLSHLVQRNGNLRVSLQKAHMTGSDAEELRRLEEQAKLTQNELFHKKKQLQRLNTDCEEDMTRLNQVKAQCEVFEKQNTHLANARAQVEGELKAQHENLDKTDQRLNRVLSNFRQRRDVRDEERVLYETSVKTRVLRDGATNVLYTLGQLSREFPEMADLLMNELQKSRLFIPTRPATRPLSARSDGSDSKSNSSGHQTSASGISSQRTGASSQPSQQQRSALPVRQFGFGQHG